MRSKPQKLARTPIFLAATMALAAFAADAVRAGEIITSDTIRSGDQDGAQGSGFFVKSGTLRLSNGTVRNFTTTGGSGSGGGGGLGGAVFVNQGAKLVVNNVKFSGNTAAGGQGGVGNVGGSLNGLHGPGQVGTQGASGTTPNYDQSIDPSGVNGSIGQAGGMGTLGAGGNGGNGGNGGSGGDRNSFLITSVAIATAEEVAAIANLAVAMADPLGTADKIMAAADLALATANLVSVSVELDNWDEALSDGQIGTGGAGGKGGNGGQGDFGYGGGAGGNGGSGGKGGANWSGSAYSGGANGGDGGDGGAGGKGGFGAGGGSGGNGGDGGAPGVSTRSQGAAGGAGAGGQGGFGGGSGSAGSDSTNADGAGGGGAGLGGAIFVRSGGTLVIQGNTHFEQGNVIGGGSANSGEEGQAAGTDLFMMKGSTVRLDAGEGHSITFDGTIADDSAASMSGTGIAVGQGAGLEVASGVVVFNNANTYTGQTKISGGALRAQDGVGIHTNSNLNLAGGVLLTNGVFNRHVGSNSNRVQWTGSGGFAAVDGDLTVSLNGGAGLTWDRGGFVNSGDALLLGSRHSTDNVTFINSVNLNGKAGIVLVEANADNSNEATLKGVFSNGSLTIGDATHTGTVILAGANSYSGTTNINGGKVVTTSAGRLGDATAVTVASGASLALGGVERIGSLAGAGSVSVGAHRLHAGGDNTSTTFSGVMGGTGGLTKEGSGTMTLAGANTYTGATVVNGGMLATASSERIADASAVAVASGASLALGGVERIGSLAGAGSVSVGAHRLHAGGDNTSTTFSGVMGGTGGLTKEGSGTMTLAGANTYAGATVVNGGMLATASSERIADASAVAVASGASLALGGVERIGSLAGAGSVSVGAHRLHAGGDNTSTTFSGVMGGTGGLTKEGSGTMTLAGANTYTGATQVNAGAVVLSGTLASSALGVTQNSSLTITQGGLSANASVSNAGTLTLQSDDQIAQLTSSGRINGSGTLTAQTYALLDGSVVDANLGTGSMTTQGQVQLNGTSGAETVEVRTGSTLTLGAPQRLNNSAAVTVDGKLVLGNGDQTVRTLNGGGQVDMLTYNLLVTNGGIFTGTLTTSGNLTNNGGMLNLDGSSNTTTDRLDLSGGGQLSLLGNARLTAGNATVGSGSTLTLVDSSHFHYDTLGGGGTINAGSFGNVSGSTVGGSLTFTGDFTNQGTLAPGYSPGVVTILGNYTEANELQIELGSTTPVTGHDQVRVGGTVTLLPGSTLTVQTWNGTLPARGNVYQVIADTNGLAKRVSGSFGNVLFDADGVAGPGAALQNAAAVFDVATGRVIATGLNQAGSTFADLGSTTSQRAAAAALFARATADLGVNQLDSGLGGSTESVGRNAVEFLTAGPSAAAKLAPEYYGAMADYGFSATSAVSRLLVDRAAGAFGDGADKGNAFFAAGLHDDMRPSSDSTLRRRELLVGAEFRATRSLDFGAVLTGSEGSIGGEYGSGSVEGQALRVYFKGHVGERLKVLGGLGYGAYRYDLRRTAVSGVASGNTRGSGSSANLGLVYSAYRSSNFALTPYVNVDYGRFNVEGFAETGSSHRLVLGDYRTSRATGTLGSTFEWKLQMMDRPLTLSAHAGAQRVFNEGNRTQAARLGVDETMRFPLTYETREKTQAVLGLGAALRLSEAVSASTAYDRRGSGGKDDSLRVQLNIRF